MAGDRYLRENRIYGEGANGEIAKTNGGTAGTNGTTVGTNDGTAGTNSGTAGTNSGTAETDGGNMEANAGIVETDGGNMEANSVNTENDRILTMEQAEEYLLWLKEEEREKNTIDKYRRDLKQLHTWLDGRPLTKLLVAEWKANLLVVYMASSVNSMLAAAKGFFEWMGWYDLKVKYLKIQKKVFCDKNKELTKEEYDKMVALAKELGNLRLSLLLETLCGAGLRVSELKFVTVEAAKKGTVEIVMKGKVRTVMFQESLAKKLVQYAREHNIESGEIFITKSGKSMSRSQIWREMKKLSEKAGVEKEKVFPHNLRHLFARMHFQKHNNIMTLSDLLGHSSVETTRIYLISTGEEHARQIEMLGLVS